MTAYITALSIALFIGMAIAGALWAAAKLSGAIAERDHNLQERPNDEQR